jgi:hypothetical protein
MQQSSQPTLRHRRCPALPVICALVVFACGCAVHIPAASPWNALETGPVLADESQLLDVGVIQFSGNENGRDGKDQDTAGITRAETRYMPVMLQYTLQQTGHWGAVNVLPEENRTYDVNVSGRIIDSSPHTLDLEITASDASGREWYTRRYTEHVGENVYGDDILGVNDPFQGLYNRIANDLHEWRGREIPSADVVRIREMSALQFGRAFLPGHYARFIAVNRKGISSVTGLPAADDPFNTRMMAARQRDRAFHELLQQHYLDYAAELADPYFQYRRAAFRELSDLREQQTDARNQMLAGALWVGIGVATADVDSLLSTTASTAMILKGGGDLIAGISAFPDESVFMQEINESFANDEAVETVGLDDSVVILSGSVEQMYSEWRSILAGMLAEEAGP